MASTNRSLPLNPLVCPTCEQVVRHRCAGPPPAKPQLPGQMHIHSEQELDDINDGQDLY